MPTHAPVWKLALLLLVACTVGVESLVSTKSPEDLGFRRVRRGPDARPVEELLCLPNASRFPLDTSRWWVPAISPQAAQTPAGRQISPLPYITTLDPSSLAISYPYVKSEEDEIRTIIEPVTNDWVVTSEHRPSRFCLQAADQLTATFAWYTAKGPVMQAYLARGSPYITLRFSKSAPVLSTAQSIRKLLVDDVEVPCEGRPFAAHTILVQLRESDTEWLLWLPPNTMISCSTGPPTTYSQAGPPVAFRVVDPSFMGIIRLALSNNCTTGERSPSTGSLPVHCERPGVQRIAPISYRGALRQASGVFPVAADVQLSRMLLEVTTTITWRTQPCWDNATSAPLLMIARPHHAQQFAEGSVTVIPVGGHRTLTGYNAPVLAAKGSWLLVVPVVPIPWLGIPDGTKVPDIRDSLLNHDGAFDLEDDAQKGIIDPYNAGKLLARMARLVLIADDLGEKKLLEQYLLKLQKYLGLWLDRESGNVLLYDNTWGSIVTCGCHYEGWGGMAFCANNASNLECPALSDAGFDFGNAYFSDHHIQYGYFIYAAAVLAKCRPAWATKYDDVVQLLIRDIANPNPADPYFPAFRVFDWYAGHSWSTGLVSGPAGLGHEFGGEALNAHYAIYLYGVATANEALMTTGEALLLTEAQALRLYWQIQPDAPMYPPGFQHKVVGSMMERLVEFRTSFGHQPFFVYAAQFIPITPVVHLSVDLQWLRRGFQVFQQSCERDTLCEESGFVAFMVAAQALLYKEVAWKAAVQLDPSIFDMGCIGCNGNSRTNLLNFIASSQATTVVPAEFQGNWHSILLGWCVISSLAVASLWMALYSPIRRCLQSHEHPIRELWAEDDDEDSEGINSPPLGSRQELYFGPDAKYGPDHLSAASKYGATG